MVLLKPCSLKDQHILDLHFADVTRICTWKLAGKVQYGILDAEWDHYLCSQEQETRTVSSYTDHANLPALKLMY